MSHPCPFENPRLPDDVGLTISADVNGRQMTIQGSAKGSKLPDRSRSCGFVDLLLDVKLNPNTATGSQQCIKCSRRITLT